MAPVEPLSPEFLCQRCDAAALPFKTTAELEEPEGFLGQERALEALRFGVGMARDGYNVFALGPPGLGKHTVVRRIIADTAATEPVPTDWCYVNNFAEARRPSALELPPGLATVLCGDMKQLVHDLRAAVPAAFESDDYQTRKAAIEGEVKQQHDHTLEEIQQRARESDIALIRTPAGLGFAPMRDGEVVAPDAFQALPEDERRRIEGAVENLQAELQVALRELPAMVKEGRRRLSEFNREVIGLAVGHLIDDLRKAHSKLDNVLGFLDAVERDIVDNADAFVRSDEAGRTEGQTSPIAPASGPERYTVKLMVDRGGETGAPIVYEDHPTYQRLLGDIEHIAHMGALVTDFTLIKPGALHRANGGYLILDAHKLLQQPYAYEALKQALRAREIRIEPLGHAASAISTRSLEPEPIPLDVKVVLIGDRALYYQMAQHDPDFGDLFKVAADFDDRVERTEDNIVAYAKLIGAVAKNSGLKPLDRSGVARAIEHGARIAGDAERLTVQVASIADLLREADFWSAKAGKEVIDADDVQHAIDAQVRRASRIKERMEEEVHRGTILIDTAGAKVGQVNGLSVIQLGGYAFGRPCRITARVRPGKGELIDIEREVELGGPLHSKGVLILAGYLGAHFAVEGPLSLAASLVFEQSYGGVDGDSASSAELYALLSALAEMPIRQSLAVTGSVNQRGEVQAIGGVNEKIEGFFDLCRGRGLTGDHGVLIPASNVKHLMLRADVVEAVARGEFHVYPIETVDQGIECLTGVAAGERSAEGRFPYATINHGVEARLKAFAETLRAFASGNGARNGAP